MTRSRMDTSEMRKYESKPEIKLHPRPRYGKTARKRRKVMGGASAS